ITDYNASKVATVDLPWLVALDNTTTTYAVEMDDAPATDGNAGVELALQSDPVVNFGTVVAVATGPPSTLTLAANASNRTDFYKGCTLWITSGAGAGSTRQITGQSGQTVTVDQPWVTLSVPNTSSTYAISMNYVPIASANFPSTAPANWLGVGAIATGAI